MTSTESAKREVIFLFGAGASIDAGIPGTYEFVKEFEDYIKLEKPHLIDPLSKITKICEDYNEKHDVSERSKQVDVEQLLDILRRLINQEKDILLHFYEKENCRLNFEEKTFTDLQTLLEDFIREKVIAKKENLRYLHELLMFDTPIEIYSTNYDTCIEQLSYLNYRSYTDGFDVLWNKKNFEKDYDIKHYKMHGSIIWYQNIKTKECVKIPVRAFSDDGTPVRLKLIYGDDVAPLLIYPAQKSDYIEPLTDLQLMFKERLFSKITKVVVIVGYSFRDDYIIHMLWDAARVNEDLHIVLIAPNAKEIFDTKLKFIDKDSKSRIHDRVICLPYPFSSVIHELKNHYLRNLSALCRIEKENITYERSGINADLRTILQLSIDCEFLTKTESVINRLGENFDELEQGRLLDPNWLNYAIKGLLSSIAVGDGNENLWIQRANKILGRINTESLQVKNVQQSGFSIGFRFPSGGSSYYEYDNRDITNMIGQVLPEKERKLRLLGPVFKTKIDKINENFDRLAKFKDYLSFLNVTGNWEQYKELRRLNHLDIDEFNIILKRYLVSPVGEREDQLKKALLGFERKVFAETVGADALQLKPV